MPDASEMTPCYFPASLVGNNQFHRMTVTRIGRGGAQLTGEAPLAPGGRWCRVWRGGGGGPRPCSR